MTASEIVSLFLEKVGTPEEHHRDGPFYVVGQGVVTLPRLRIILWETFRAVPPRSAVADAYETLLALANRRDVEEPVISAEPEMPKEPEPEAPAKTKTKTRRTK